MEKRKYILTTIPFLDSEWFMCDTILTTFIQLGSIQQFLSMLGIMLSYREKPYPLLYPIVIYNTKHKAEMATLALSQAAFT